MSIFFTLTIAFTAGLITRFLVDGAIAKRRFRKMHEEDERARSQPGKKGKA